MAQPFSPIRDSDFLLADIAHEIPARIWVKDTEGRYVFVNRTLVDQVNLDREQWIGSTDEDLFPGVGHVYWRKDLQVLSTQKPLVTTDQAGDKFIFVLRFPIAIEGRRHVVGVGVETTDQISVLVELFRLRDEAFRNERLRAIGEMATNIAHDLGNSLNSASLRLTLVQRKAGPELQTDIAALSRSINAASDRVHAIQEFVKTPNQEEMEPFELRSVLRDAIGMVGFLIEKIPTENGAFIRIESSIPDSLAPLVGPPNQLKHVFSNLMLNARDAMPDGGTLKIEVRQDASAVKATVSDEGAGIAPELIEKVFEPFFTTKRLGNGLGLSMARDVMKRLGGSITAANLSPKGAAFTLTFPIPAERE